MRDLTLPWRRILRCLAHQLAFWLSAPVRPFYFRVLENAQAWQLACTEFRQDTSVNLAVLDTQMHWIVWALFCFQAPEQDQMLRSLDAIQEDQIYRESLLRHLQSTSDPAAEAIAQRAAASHQEKLFVAKFNRFLRLLGDFADHYNSRHAIDIKQLKAVKKAWQDLEKTDSRFREATAK